MDFLGLSVYQWMVPLFAVIMIAKAVSRFGRHTMTARELGVWIVVWSGVSCGALFPDFCMVLFSRITGIKSGFNALIFFTLVILVYGFLQLYVAMEAQERRMTELVRKFALSSLQTQGPAPSKTR